MGNWDVSKPDNDGERELLDRAVKAFEAEFATKTCNKQIASKLEDAELARDSEETCNNKQVISKLVASDDCISIQVVIEWLKAKDIIKLSSQEETARKELKALPSVTPKQRTGKWQEVYAETDYRNGWIEFSCENCEYQHGLESGEYGWSYGDPIPWKYCPICGARMVEPKENCDTCKHKDDGWDSEQCDGCCGNHSGFEPQESEEISREEIAALLAMGSEDKE